ncbi:formate dehydrogenase accessory sulfurtransferase FdhD [Candidatus Poribacteria bacterium]|nr:formate dehydrogenase accessory sulfurtransferase FdhD [Candidatus Poribacteria bacterium]
MRSASEHSQILRVIGERSERTLDTVAVEEPLEIRIRHRERVSTLLATMRTPGNDDELAAGLLFGERIIRSRDDVLDISHSTDRRLPKELRANAIVVTLPDDHSGVGREHKRTLMVNTSCGVCGRTSIEGIHNIGFPELASDWKVSPTVLGRMPDVLRTAQAGFDRTGAVHAAGLFDLEGNLLSLREDIGRHNAVDKLVGREWIDERTPLDKRIVLVSGRSSFEIVQKCLTAAVPLLASVGAPSSLAVDLALESGMTLVGFLRDGRMNVYSAPERIVV